MFGRSKKSKMSGHVETLIGRSAQIEGDVAFKGGLHLDGRIVGNVHTEPGGVGALWISEQGVIEGLVDVASIVLNGTVIGDIYARERLIMGAKARVQGNVYYGVIEMSPGAEVSGRLLPTNPATEGAQSVLPAPAVAVAARESSEPLRDEDAESLLVGHVFDARRAHP